MTRGTNWLEVKVGKKIYTIHTHTNNSWHDGTVFDSFNYKLIANRTFKKNKRVRLNQLATMVYFIPSKMIKKINLLFV